MTNRNQDKKERVYAWLPRAEDIPPNKVFGVGEGTAQRLYNEAGIGLKAALNNLERLKREDRAHIHTWTNTKQTAPVWVKGPGEDAPRPEPVMRAELRAKYKAERDQKREREKTAGSLGFNSIQRTTATIEQARVQPVQWWSGLGNMPTAPAEDAA